MAHRVPKSGGGSAREACAWSRGFVGLFRAAALLIAVSFAGACTDGGPHPEPPSPAGGSSDAGVPRDPGRDGGAAQHDGGAPSGAAGRPGSEPSDADAGADRGDACASCDDEDAGSLR